MYNYGHCLSSSRGAEAKLAEKPPESPADATAAKYWLTKGKYIQHYSDFYLDKLFENKDFPSKLKLCIKQKYFCHFLPKQAVDQCFPL